MTKKLFIFILVSGFLLLTLAACGDVPTATQAVDTMSTAVTTAPTQASTAESTVSAAPKPTEIATEETEAPVLTATVDAPPPPPAFLRPTELPRSDNLSTLSTSAAKAFIALNYVLDAPSWKSFIDAGSPAAASLKNTLLAEQTYFYWAFRQANILANKENPSVLLTTEIVLADGRKLSVDDPKVGKGVPFDQYPSKFPYKTPSQYAAARFEKGAFDSVDQPERSAFALSLQQMKDQGPMYIEMMNAVGQLAGYDASKYTDIYAVANEMARAVRNLSPAVDAFNLKQQCRPYARRSYLR